MKQTLLDIIDRGSIRSLLESFSEATDTVTALLDLDGNVLVAGGWRDICTRFHRTCPGTLERCRESDTSLAGALGDGSEFHLYRCLNGLVDVAVPVVIRGQHVANMFTGQFLLEPPDLAFYRRQAVKFGFDEEAYLDALSHVPVFSDCQVRKTMSFLLHLTGILADMGLRESQLLGAMAALEDSEEHSRTLIAEMPNGFCLHEIICDDEGTPVDYRFLKVNAAFEAMTGLVAAEVIGRTVLEVLPDTEPEWIQRYGAVALTGENACFERYSRELGKHFEVLAYSLHRGEFAVVLTDISERLLARKHEQLVTQVLEALNRSSGSSDAIRDVLAVIHAGMDVEAVGIRLRDGLDYPYFETRGFPAEFVEAERHLCVPDVCGDPLLDSDGVPVLDCMCGAVICGRDNATLPVLSPGGSFWSNCTTELLATTSEVERQGRTRNRCNDEGYESVALIPLRSGQDTIGLLQLNDHRRHRFTPQTIEFLERVGQSIGVAFQRQHAEAERRRLEERLISLQKLESIGTLASGVAHEINNPINGIMGYADLITRNTDPENPSVELARGIKCEAERIATVSGMLLTFAQQNRTHIKQAVRIADVVADALDVMDSILRRDKITLRVLLPETLPDVMCRRRQTQQVLLNLMTNARDALNERYSGHHENKLLTITARVLTVDGIRMLRLSVEDHGTGISPENQRRLFEPFFTTKERAIGAGSFGTGLGLAVSHGIVREDGGMLSVESELGQFTRVHLDIPIAPDAGLEDTGRSAVRRPSARHVALPDSSIGPDPTGRAT